MKRDKAGPPQRPSTLESLRGVITSDSSNISSYFLVRPRQKKEVGSGDTESTEISPCGQSNSELKSRKLQKDHSTSNDGGSEPKEGPVEVSVIEWEEKRSTATLRSEYNQLRQVVSPPRPPKDGMEWVWFPEGYWAERERKEQEFSLRKQHSGLKSWLNKSSPTGNSSIPLPRRSAIKSRQSVSKLSTRPIIPQIKIGSVSSGKRFSRASEFARTNNEYRKRSSASNQDPSNQDLQPVSSTAEKDGLYCRAKRNLEHRFSKRSKTPSDHSSTPSSHGPASRTTMLLQGTTNYLERAEREKTERLTTRPAASPNPSTSPVSIQRRGFGLAPWHRRYSNESLLSASSSVHKILMGKAPAATPNPGDRSPDGRGKQHLHIVDLTDPSGPSFLPSEARRIKTPPMSEGTPTKAPAGFFLDYPSLAEGSNIQTEIGSACTTPGSRSVARSMISGHSSVSREAREQTSSRNAIVRTTRRTSPPRKPPPPIDKVDSCIPDHLQSSPLCPRHPKHKSQGRATCFYHGRTRVTKQIERQRLKV